MRYKYCGFLGADTHYSDVCRVKDTAGGLFLENLIVEELPIITDETSDHKSNTSVLELFELQVSNRSVNDRHEIMVCGEISGRHDLDFGLALVRPGSHCCWEQLGSAGERRGANRRDSAVSPCTSATKVPYIGLRHTTRRSILASPAASNLPIMRYQVP